MTRELRVSDVVEPTPSTWLMIRRAMRRRCPRCGSNGQFHGWLHRNPHCPGCGYAIERSNDFFLGAYLLNLMLTLTTMFCVLMFVVICGATHTQVPVVPTISVGLFFAIALPVIAYPYSYTMWAVFDLRSDPLELREIAKAVENLEQDGSDDESISSGH